MPKYIIEAVTTSSFEFDTEDYAEDFKDNDLDPNDPDVIHDFVRELLENDGPGNFDTNPSIDTIKVTARPKK